MQTLLCTCNRTRHYAGTRHNYKIKYTKTTEIHKPEGSALLTPHPPLKRNIFRISHFLQLSVRSFYAGFSSICSMCWSVSPSRGSSLQDLDYGQFDQRMYLSRLSHSTVPTTAVSPLSPFSLKSEECPLSETLWDFWSETMDNVKNVSYGLWPNLQSRQYKINHSKTSCGSTASVHCEKYMGLKWNHYTHFLNLFYWVNGKLIIKQKLGKISSFLYHKPHL